MNEWNRAVWFKSSALTFLCLVAYKIRLIHVWKKDDSITVFRYRLKLILNTNFKLEACIIFYQNICVMKLTWCTFHSIYWESRASTSIEHYLLILRRRYTNSTCYIACVLCQLAATRIRVECSWLVLNKLNEKWITLVSLYWYTMMHGQQNIKFIEILYIFGK
jgi:hypothetical protein